MAGKEEGKLMKDSDGKKARVAAAAGVTLEAV